MNATNLATRAGRSRRYPADRGFSLIELLVVIIIIGILGAIAIPVYLSQRTRAFDAAARSDLQQVAQTEEAYRTESPTYGSIADLTTHGYALHLSPGVTVTLMHIDSGQSYCVSAKQANSQVTWYYDSLAGGSQAQGSTGCPQATTGPSGGSLTG